MRTPTVYYKKERRGGQVWEKGSGVLGGPLRNELEVWNEGKGKKEGEDSQEPKGD